MLKRSLLFAALLLAGCASGPHGVNAENKPKEIVRMAVVESITPIEMDDSSNGGSMAGGIFGQVGGANSGGGRGAAVGSVLGSVLGGTLGQQAGIGTRPGLELWVKVDNDEQSTYVMQPGKPDAFKVGERVRLVQKMGVLRVEPLPAETAPPPAMPKP
ncbi:MAG: hypothetical protein PHF75_05565 [Gallionella sp.]|nr:hypothetical protein [Gallionella sp.]